MGDRLRRSVVRQHSDLSSAKPIADRQRPVLLALLAVDGVLCAIAGAFFLPLHLGSWPFPISALFVGLVNAALAWAALQLTPLPWAALPLVTWLLTVAVLSLGGPGDDIVFGGAGIVDYVMWAVLIVLGALPPVAVLRRQLNT